MSARRYVPCPELRPWVAGYEVLESGGELGAHRVLPGVEPVMGFQYRGRVAALDQPEERLLEVCGITGIQMEARRYRNMPGTGTVLVRFHPWGAAAFLRAPMREIAGMSVGLDALAPARAVREARERLEEAGTDAERIGAIEGFLLSLVGGRAPDGAIRRAVRWVQSGETGGSVRELAGRLGLGERQVERKFQEWVGVGPKRFARLARFQGMVARMRVFPHSVGAGLEHGFHDQAHLIKDFRSFAGMTPGAFLRDLSRDVGFLQ